MEDNYEKITNKNDFLNLIKALSKEDFSGWENSSLETYLLALAHWLEDSEGFYKNRKLRISHEEPSWQLFADALQAATIYE